MSHSHNSDEKYGLTTAEGVVAPHHVDVDQAHQHGNDNDHLAFLYEEQADQFPVIGPFIKRGLERGEQCLYVVDDNTETDVLTALRDHGVDVDAALDTGALSLVTPADTYRRTGTFDQRAMLDYLQESLREAIDDREFTGLRATAEMSWVLDSPTPRDHLRTYEAALNAIYSGEDYVAMCQYNRTRFPATLLSDIVRTHPLIITDTTVYRNGFYTPPDDFRTSPSASLDIDHVITQLHDQTETGCDARPSVSVRDENSTVTSAPFGALFENAPEPIIAYEFESGEPIIRMVNHAFEETFQFDASRVVGTPVNDVLVPPDESIESQTINALAQVGDHVEAYVRRCTADGVQTFELQTIPVTVDNEVDGFARYTKLTAQDWLQEVVLSVLDRLPAGILVENQHREILTVNEQFCELMNVPTTDAIVGRDGARALDDIKDQVTASDQFASRTKEVLTQREEVHGEQWRLIDGRTVERSHIPFTLPDTEGSLWFYQDVTEHEDRRRQLRVFHRILRHNIANNMTVILGHGNDLASDLSGGSESAAKAIVAAADQLLAHITKHRKIIELMNDAPEPRSIALDEVVQQTVQELRAAYPAASITVGDIESVGVRVIPQFGLAIEELITNAVVHNDQETPVVELSIEEQSGVAELRVVDNGPGLPAEEARILRGDQEVDPLDHGVGMGLWLVYWIVRVSGGKIAVSNRDDRGTVIDVELPDVVSTENV